MASYVPVIKNGANGCILYTGLVDQSNTKLLKSTPTLATGDFKVSIDGGALANLGTLPTVTPAAGRQIKITLSQAEVNGDNITIQCVDAAGAEWCDQLINIQTVARQIDDLAFPATSGRSIVVDAAGLVDANMVKSGPTGSGTAQTARDIGGAVPAAAAGASGGLLISGSNAGTTTLGALTVTGATTLTGNVALADGLTVAAPSTGNRSGITVTGNGTGHGISVTGGNGATGDGIKAVAASTNGNGFNLLGTGTGAGIIAQGGGTGAGIKGTGGGTSGNGIHAVGGTNSSAFNAAGTGTGNGINAASGTGATGDGIKASALSTNGHGMELIGVGTGDGLIATGGASAGGDGGSFVAGGGVDLRAAITGNITGNLSGSVGSLTGYAAPLDAAGTRSAVGLASANLDTQLDALPTNTELATALGTADDAVLAALVTAQADLDNIQTRIPAALTGAGNLKVDILAINGTAVTGAGTAGSPWGP